MNELSHHLTANFGHLAAVVLTITLHGHSTRGRFFFSFFFFPKLHASSLLNVIRNITPRPTAFISF